MGIAKIPGEFIDVKVNAGKITASFDHIAMQNSFNIYDTAYISGTLIQSH